MFTLYKWTRMQKDLGNHKAQDEHYGATTKTEVKLNDSRVSFINE